ncbi:MAG: HAMP domain-containing protein [Elusimicrobiales bacterium]|nr:HAMP domain-containing protein [Elusimicrobiales bacterium]
MSGIFRKFFNTIISVGIIPIIFVVILIFYYQSVSRRNLQNNYQKLCDSFAISSYESINNFAKRLDYLNYLKYVYKDDDEFLKKTSEKYEEIVFIALLDSTGSEIKRYSTYSFSKLFSYINISRKEYFNRIKGSKDGVIGDFQIIRSFPLATIVYPVGDKFVYAVVNLKKFFSYIYQTKIGQTGMVFFISDNGVVLNDSNIDINYKEMEEIVKSDYGNTEMYINGKKYISFFRKLNDVNIYVVLAQEKREFLRDINLIFYSMLFLVFLVLTISYFIAFITSRNLAAPISSLISAAERVSGGNFEVPVTEKSDFAELNELVRVFNLMMEKLNDYSKIQIEKLMDEREKLNIITQNLKDAVILTDSSFSPVFVNRSAQGLVGNDYNRIKDIINSVVKRLSDNKNKIVEFKNKYFEIYFDNIKLHRDNPLMLIVARDVTAEMRINKVKEDVFRSVAHDLRSPLLNMQGYIKLLSYDADEKNMKYIKGLEDESNIVFRMLENILDMSRIENKTLNLNIRKTNLKELLKNIAERFEIRAETKGIEFFIRLPDYDVFADLDDELFLRAVDNILTNAFKYTDEGGRVELMLERTDKIYIIISDTGKGIEKERLADIFDRFKTTSRSGFGLGLSIAKTIVEMHKGNISVDSEIGKGTRFVIEI